MHIFFIKTSTAPLAVLEYNATGPVQQVFFSISFLDVLFHQLLFSVICKYIFHIKMCEDSPQFSSSKRHFEHFC